MKKFLFVVLLFLSLGIAAQDVPHPALCHYKTNEPYPSFFAVQPPFNGISVGDWIGVYSFPSMKCYGCEEVVSLQFTGNFAGYGDYVETAVIEGFVLNEEMKPFIYKASMNKFYSLNVTVQDYTLSTEIPFMKYGALNVFSLSNITIGDEIQLYTDPVLSEVIFCFINPEMPINTGGKESIKIDFIHQNTTDPFFTVAVGKGNIVKNWDGYYYKFVPGETTAVLNAVGVDNFTGLMVTSQLTLIMEVSISSNSIFEDENIVLYLKGDQVWLKIKCEKLSGFIYRQDNGNWKRTYQIGTKLQGYEVAFITANYSRSWKGTKAKIEYFYYVNGKMANLTYKENNKTVIQAIIKEFVL